MCFAKCLCHWLGREFLAGTILAFARALGEFGATLMIAGNIPGRTATIPIAIYFAVEDNDVSRAFILVRDRRRNFARLAGRALLLDTRATRLALVGKYGASAQRWRPRFADAQISKRLPEFELDVSLRAAASPWEFLGRRARANRCCCAASRGSNGPIAGEFCSATARFSIRSGTYANAGARAANWDAFSEGLAFSSSDRGRKYWVRLGSVAREERAKRVSDWMERTHIQGLEHRRPREFSGGEQQRAALARALATEPEALLLDEPLTALDTHLRSQVEAQLQETFVDFRRPVLLVTHNIEEAYRLGEKLMLLARGKVVAFGAKEDIFRHPPTRTAAQLTGCKNFSRARLISDHEIEAIDWACRLGIAPTRPLGPKPPAFVAIRAHHIEFVGMNFPDQPNPASPTANIFDAWPVRTSETPFRVTLYLSLSRPTADPSQYHLQAEVYKEKWRQFRDRAQPWRIRLSTNSLMLMPE